MSDDGQCEAKHVALCDMTLQCCVGQYILFVCDTEWSASNVYISYVLLL